MSSSALIALKNRFVALSGAVSGIIPSINSSSSHVNAVINSLNENYNYDDMIADLNFNEKNKSEIDEISSTLSNSVLPAIDDKIAELERLIQEALAREAAEEAAREAERNSGFNF